MIESKRIKLEIYSALNLKQKPMERIYSQVSFRIRDNSIILYITVVLNILQKKKDFQDGSTY